MSLFIAAAIAFVVGLVLAGLVHLVRIKGWEAKHRVAQARLDDAEGALAREREERRCELENLQMTFKGLSSEILKESRDEFLKQAEPKIGEHTRPLADALKRYEEAIRSIENKREEAYGSLKGLLDVLKNGQTELTRETSSLVSALKSPAARGRWGEVRLRGGPGRRWRPGRPLRWKQDCLVYQRWAGPVRTPAGDHPRGRSGVLRGGLRGGPGWRW